MLTSHEAVQGQLVSFYKNIVGTCAPAISAIDPMTMRSGPRLSYKACCLLIQPIIVHDIDSTLKSIDDSKAPGVDGFTSFFL